MAKKVSKFLKLKESVISLFSIVIILLLKNLYENGILHEAFMRTFKGKLSLISLKQSQAVRLQQRFCQSKTSAVSYEVPDLSSVDREVFTHLPPGSVWCWQDSAGDQTKSRVPAGDKQQELAVSEARLCRGVLRQTLRQSLSPSRTHRPSQCLRPEGLSLVQRAKRPRLPPQRLPAHPHDPLGENVQRRSSGDVVLQDNPLQWHPEAGSPLQVTDLLTTRTSPAAGYEIPSVITLIRSQQSVDTGHCIICLDMVAGTQI